MNIERLFADFQLAEMEHNAQQTEVSLEKYETAKFAYERAVEKLKEPAPKKQTEKPAPSNTKTEIPKTEAPANTKTAAPANSTPKTEAPVVTPPAPATEEKESQEAKSETEEEKKTE